MMETLTVNAVVENLPEVIAFVTEPLADLGCSDRIRLQLELVVEEAFVNIASYAYSPATGSVTIERAVEKEPAAVCVVFKDCGVPYNPLEKPDPDITAPVEKRPIGGFGIFLVKNNVDAISYEHKDGQNILRIRKNLSEHS